MSYNSHNFKSCANIRLWDRRCQVFWCLFVKLDAKAQRH